MKNFKGRERFKVKSVNCEYELLPLRKTVVAKAKFEFQGITFKTEGKATAKNEEFNLETGKKLARARAEKKAYIIAKNETEKQIKDASNLMDVLINTSWFLGKCRDHQTDYIKSF
jgi:cytochrome c biogenesis factor